MNAWRFCVIWVMPLGLLMQASVASAASLYIDPPTSELNRGDAIELSIRVDTDESIRECVNIVDAVIEYSPNVAPVDVSIGDSIVSLWVQDPVINKESRTISFAGGIPNGYCGRVQGDPRLTNTIAKIIIRSPGLTVGGGDDTEGTVSFAPETSVYLNDGRGTQAPLKTYGAKIKLNPKPGSEILDPWSATVDADTIPPEEFSIVLEKDTRAFSGQYYISFNTTDKQTGIDQYQVIEEPLSELGSFRWGGVNAPWIVTRSPYVLKDQTLNSTIRVKAIDKAGNEYIATLVPDPSLRTGSASNVFTFILLGIVILLTSVFGVVFWHRRRNRTKKINDDAMHMLNQDNETHDTTN